MARPVWGAGYHGLLTMRVSEGIEGLRGLPAGAVLSIGNFDGVHLGHASILHRMRCLRDATPGARLAVVTFEPHPLAVLRPQLAPPRLTPAAMKRRLLESADVDELVVLQPSPQVLDMTAEQFWGILREQVRPAHLVEGVSFSFGKGRSGTIAKLRLWSAQAGIALHVIDPVHVPLLNLHIVEASSTVIRWLVWHGRMRDAAICLGRPYELAGKVIPGHGRGRSIGVPTANLDCQDQLIPADGVYAGRCRIDGTIYPAAVSIGTTPTFGDCRRQVEAHLIGFQGRLYDKIIHLEILDWLREQIRFSGVQALKTQLALDFDAVRLLASSDPALPIARMTV